MQSAQITVGDTVSVEMHKADSGLTAFDVSLGDRERCSPPSHKFAVMWNDVAARVSAC